MRTNPRVFVSYSYDDDEHRAWVEQLASRLRKDGVDCRLDLWDVEDSPLPDFMDREVRLAERVIVVCTPDYRERVHAAEEGRSHSGVSWEVDLLKSEMFVKGTRNKVVPVLARGTWHDAAPSFLAGHKYWDLSGVPREDLVATTIDVYRDLLDVLLNRQPTAPPLGLPEARSTHPAGWSLHNLPRYPREFVGRVDALSALTRWLQAGDADRPEAWERLAISGLPGVGKSAVALAFAWANRGGFESTCWIDASNPDIGVAALAEQPFDLGLRPGAPVAERLEAVQQRLGRGGPHLLVFDGLDQRVDVDRWIGPEVRARVLATTRLDDLPGFRHLHLETLTPAEALEILGVASDSSSEERAAGLGLAETFGFLGLPMSVAGEMLKRSSWWPTKLLARIEREGGPVAWSASSAAHDLSGEKPPRSLVALFDTCVEHLDPERATDVLARRILFAAAWWEAVPVPPLAFCSAVRSGPKGEPDFNLLEDALARLVDVGLAALDLNGSLRLHALVAEYARMRGGAASRLDGLSLLAEEAKTLRPHSLVVPVPGLGGLSLSQIEPHLLACADMRDRDAPEEVGWIPMRLAEYYEAGGDIDRALEVLRGAVASGLGEAWPARLGAMAGRLLADQGEVDPARTALEQALPDVIREQGVCHEESIRAVVALAQLMREQGASEEAADLLEPFVEPCADAAAPSPYGQLVRETAARVHWSLGDVEAALEHQLAAVAIEEFVPQLGYEIRAPARTALTDMFVALALNGWHDLVSDSITTAVSAGLVRSPDRSVVAAQHAAGHSLMVEDRFVEALPYLESALVGAQELPEPDAFDIGATRFALGMTLLGLDRPADALEHLEIAYEIARHVMAPDDPHLEQTANLLTRAREALEDPDVDG